MSLDNKSINEINEVISAIEKELKPGCEIGARDRSTLQGLLKANKIEKKAKFFACRREHSDKIVLHFVKHKNVTQSKFHVKAQTYIFVVC